MAYSYKRTTEVTRLSVADKSSLPASVEVKREISAIAITAVNYQAIAVVTRIIWHWHCCLALAWLAWRSRTQQGKFEFKKPGGGNRAPKEYNSGFQALAMHQTSHLDAAEPCCTHS